MKVLIGVFLTPVAIWLAFSMVEDDMGKLIIAACAVGLLWVGIVAWKRQDRPKPDMTGGR